jgi:hypothetical protein
MAEHRRQQKERWAREREERSAQLEQNMTEVRKRSMMTVGMWPVAMGVSYKVAPTIAAAVALPAWLPYLTLAALGALLIGTVGREGPFTSRLLAARWVALWTTAALGVFVLLGAGPE